MKTFVAILGAATLLAAGQAIAADEFKLAQRSGCLSCHRGVEVRVGPPYKEVAERYAGRADAEAVLAAHIVDGTGPTGLGWMKEGKASQPFMPPNGNVTPDEARRLAKWILGVRAEIVDFSRFVSDRVAVSGAVENRLDLGVDDLRRIAPPREIAVALRSGEQVKFTGVLLRDVLKKAVLASQSHFDPKKTVVVVTASDGYRVVFSLAEVLSSPIGDGVLVFFEKNGKPLEDSEGRLAMVSTADNHVGSRYLKWLRTIEVRRIVD